jgi:peptidylprolyl isomerase
VLRRLRRSAPLILPVVLLLALTACGSGTASSTKTYEGLDAVTITGDFGSQPTVKWKGEMTADKAVIKTLHEGDGAAIQDGDKIDTNIWIGNGYTQQKAYSTYDDGKPQTLTVSSSLSKPFLDAMTGQKIGARVAITAPADALFGEGGNPDLSIGNKDTVLVILDLMEPFAEPKAEDVPQSRLPSPVLQGGDPVSLDFSGVPAPKAGDGLLRHVIKVGKGIPVTQDMTLKVNYLGMVYQGDKPFDESYSKEPASFALTSVVPGWTYGLSGMTVGSRVELAIPPDLGYGAQAKTGIPANSTLYFVINIISAKK